MQLLAQMDAMNHVAVDGYIPPFCNSKTRLPLCSGVPLLTLLRSFPHAPPSSSDSSSAL